MHRLTNGSLFTVAGFTRRGDIIVDDGWVIDRDFGHLTHGYVMTSHASQCDTVDKVFVAISSESLPATNQRTAYVALTRGKEQAVVFTDDRKELLKAITRLDDPISATELAEPGPVKPTLRDQLMGRMAFARGFGIFGQRKDSMQQETGDRIADRGLDHADDITYQERLRRTPPPSGLNAILQSKEMEPERGEASCGAFGYLRGIRDHAAAVEFRFRNGNSVWFPYNWLGTWQYNPSEGLLLKFSGDLVYLVLIRGSNLDKPLGDGAINPTHAGLQRHRVLWLREMRDKEVQQVGEQGPTIDCIEVAEFTLHEALTKWLKERAPAFLIGPA